jgi:hypothetical protein
MNLYLICSGSQSAPAAWDLWCGMVWYTHGAAEKFRTNLYSTLLFRHSTWNSLGPLYDELKQQAKIFRSLPFLSFYKK